MKDIVIVANFCRDFSESDNGRFMYLAKSLSGNNRVEIITSDFSHGKKQKRPELVHHWPFSITFIHEPGYAKNTSIKRLSSHYVWGRNVYRYLKNRNRPDIVYCAMPSLTAADKLARFCKKNGIRFVIDVQDLWPEAFKMVLNVPVLSDILFFPMKMLANGVYSRADAICAVSKTYAERAASVNPGCKETHPVFLGTDLSDFDRYASEHPFEKKDDKVLVGYCGTLGASYDLSCVIDALAILKDRGFGSVRFMVFGGGPRRKEFEDRAAAKGIDAEFAGWLPYPEMCGRLCGCDIAVNPIRGNAAQSIINKHGDYAAAGLPVINTQESVEYKNLVETYGMGFNCDNSNAEAMAEKLLVLISDADLRLQMGKNARRCAEEKFDRKNSYRELLGLFKE